MKEPLIIEKDEIRMRPAPASMGGGKKGDNTGLMSTIIHPQLVDTKWITMGTGEVHPGFAAHRWHTHTNHEIEDLKITYPTDFEELYYIIGGNGVVQWKSKDGTVKETKVSGGDIVFFPIGVAEHQLLNNSTRKIEMLWVGSPGAVQITTR